MSQNLQSQYGPKMSQFNESIPTLIITFQWGWKHSATYVCFNGVGGGTGIVNSGTEIRRSISHFGWYIAVLSARWHTNPFTDLYALIGKRETAQLNDLASVIYVLITRSPE